MVALAKSIEIATCFKRATNTCARVGGKTGKAVLEMGAFCGSKAVQQVQEQNYFT